MRRWRLPLTLACLNVAIFLALVASRNADYAGLRRAAEAARRTSLTGPMYFAARPVYLDSWQTPYDSRPVVTFFALNTPALLATLAVGWRLTFLLADVVPTWRSQLWAVDSWVDAVVFAVSCFLQWLCVGWLAHTAVRKFAKRWWPGA
jgi:hypothetical protein